MAQYDSQNNHNLEPRVAKIETGLEIVTRDVTTLGNVVREQSRNIETEIQKLAVAVTQAAAPKKTEWHTLIALAALIMVIGSAIFVPLNQKIQANKEDITAVSTAYHKHETQDGHSVELVEIRELKAKVTELEANNKDAIRKELDEYHTLKLRLIEVGSVAKR